MSLYESRKDLEAHVPQILNAGAVGVDAVSITISTLTLGGVQTLASDVSSALNTLQAALAVQSVVKIN